MISGESDSRTSTPWGDRKSTRLNSSHGYISYAVFCLKKKKQHARAPVNAGLEHGRGVLVYHLVDPEQHALHAPALLGFVNRSRRFGGVIAAVRAVCSR